MERRLFFLIFVVLVLCLSASSFAVCFDTTLLASYEPDELNCLIVSKDENKDPTLTVTWPVLGGVNGVPLATEGDYVLKLEWTNEYPKVEVRHDWNDFTFDLSGVDFIHADVYIATESAMPNVMGIWDNLWTYKWISADCEPVRTNEWRTISFCVSACNEVALDHIEALVFDKLAGTAGTIYIDNLRLGPGLEENNCVRKIIFSGYAWSVLQSDWPIGAGPNLFTDDPTDVWVDPDGYLHLSIVYKDPNWYCSEVIANENFGYGTYAFTVKGDVDSVDPNIVLGLFIYDVPDAQGNHQEIDVELTRWGNPNDPCNAQFVVQPWYHPNNVHRFKVDYTGNTETITYEIRWRPGVIYFLSYYGDYPLRDENDKIDSWCYAGADVPEAGCENPRINFYLMNGDEPTDGEDAEIVIKSFDYFPSVMAEIDLKPEVVNLRSQGQWITCYISTVEGCGNPNIGDNDVFLEEEIKAEQIRFDAKKQAVLAKFNRSEVHNMLEPGDVELTVSGTFADGTRFEGIDTIKVISPVKGKK